MIYGLGGLKLKQKGSCLNNNKFKNKISRGLGCVTQLIREKPTKISKYFQEIPAITLASL